VEYEQGSKFDKATYERSKRLRRSLSSLSNNRELSAQVFSFEAIFFCVAILLELKPFIENKINYSTRHFNTRIEYMMIKT